jgi:ribokinase
MNMTNHENSYDNLQVIVPGAMHTVVSVIGMPELPGSGQDAFGPMFHIGSGGKSRNIAEMAGWLTGPDRVAMISQTARDPYGLWKIPYDALHDAGVNTDHVRVADSEETGLYPGIAMVSVDLYGNRNASVYQSVMDSFSAENIDAALPMFEAAARNSGILALSMELPYKTAVHAMRRGSETGLRTILDPGGLAERDEYADLFKYKPYLVKPNEHEAEQLTGQRITDLSTARTAAHIMLQQGAQRVLITHAEQGAYLFQSAFDEGMHLPAPAVDSEIQTDSTGCGDQVMGALCASLGRGENLVRASRIGVVAGTMQYIRVGTPPVKQQELQPILDNPLAV